MAQAIAANLLIDISLYQRSQKVKPMLENTISKNYRVNPHSHEYSDPHRGERTRTRGSPAQLTSNLHELIKEDSREERFPELPEVEFKDPSNAVHVTSVAHVSQRVLHLLETLPEIVDLNLTARHAEYSLVM